MAQRCDVCGKGPSVGNTVSHAHKLTRRRWLPNLVSMRAWCRASPPACGSAPAASRRARSRRSFKHEHKREGAWPPPDWSRVGGRHPPPRTATSLLLLLLGRLLLLRHRGSHLLRAARIDRTSRRSLLLLLLGRLLLRHGVVTSLRQSSADSVAHRLATQVLGLLGARAARSARGRRRAAAGDTTFRPRLVEQAVEDAGVVGREEVHGAVGLAGRVQAERGARSGAGSPSR